MSYFPILAFGALTLFGVLFAIGRAAKIERGKKLMLLLCLVPTICLFSIGVILLNLPVEGATEITVDNIDSVPDPGPVSFMKAMYFGFIPAAVYLIVSSASYLLVGFARRR